MTSTKSSEPVPQVEVPKEEKLTKEKKPKKEKTPKEKKPKKEKTPKEKKPKKEKTPKEKKPKVEGEQKSRVRRTVTKESVGLSFTNLEALIVNEIKERHENKDKKYSGVKFLRNVKKQLALLHKDVERVTKTRQKVVRKNNKDGAGFTNKVKISKELSEFAGWAVDELHSREDVTNALCSYVKVHNLQDGSAPKRRIYILPDEKFSKLLRYDPKNPPLNPKTGLPINELMYRNVQQLVQVHFTPNVKVSKELSEFIGFNPDILYLRINVFNALCDYMTKNSLMTKKVGPLPNGKEETFVMVKLDDKLSKLLGKSGELRYSDLLPLVKRHLTIPAKVKA
jgi:chromatin remodeling complex protein RSC6